MKDLHSSYLRLNEAVYLKMLEKPFLYHIKRDELYELNEEAFNFLCLLDGTEQAKDLNFDYDFLKYCIDEELVELLPCAEKRAIRINTTVLPSLRYLELQLLDRCNLNCLHCYNRTEKQNELDIKDALHITSEFADLGGLRLMISGGEPLLYKDLPLFLSEIAGLPIRKVLLTNGTLIDEKMISRLFVDEIQVSLDGWREGHDLLRGRGNFEKTLRGIKLIREAGIPLSIATMIHRGNLSEFDKMRAFIEEINAIEWGIDLPVLAGNLRLHQSLLVSYEEAISYVSYAFGGGYHGSAEGYACGHHLCAVTPEGYAVKCGFYSDFPLGDARRSLKECWQKIDRIPLKEFKCRDCPVLEDCAGGCRFRAGDALSPDPFMCALYGVTI